MQEGTPAFVRMVEISRALMDHRAAGLPYLVHLRHPTTGGVFASWGSLGHVTVAEPGALIGFLGPKVYDGAQRASRSRPGVQTAENLAAHGVIDAVVAAEDLPALVDSALAVLVDPPGSGRLPLRAVAARSATDAGLGRDRARPVVPDRAGRARPARGTAPPAPLQLRGTDEGERDSTVLVALTRLDGQPCVVVGQDRSPAGARARRWARPRCARRGAGCGSPRSSGCRWSRVIDTPGAELSPEAEEGAIAGEIARCIATLTTMTVPTVVGDPRAGLRGRGAGAAAGADR